MKKEVFLKKSKTLENLIFMICFTHSISYKASIIKITYLKGKRKKKRKKEKRKKEKKKEKKERKKERKKEGKKERKKNLSGLGGQDTKHIHE